MSSCWNVTRFFVSANSKVVNEWVSLSSYSKSTCIGTSCSCDSVRARERVGEDVSSAQGCGE